MSDYDAERFQQSLQAPQAPKEAHWPDDEALRRDLLVVEALTRLATPPASPQAVERMSQKWRAAAQAQAQPAPRSLVRPRFDAWRRAAAVLAFVVLAALGSGGGVVAASSNALPNEPLYSIKRAWESLVVWVVSLVGRLEDALIHLAQTRYDELARLLALGQATPQALDDFIVAYERARALGDDPRLDELQRAARLGLAQLPYPLQVAPRYEVLRAWLNMPSALPSDQAQTTPAPASTVAPTQSSSPTPEPAQASPTLDPLLALSQTQAALQAQLEQTAQALALTQTALVPTSSPTPSPTSRFAPTATRTPQPSPASILASATATQPASATPTPSATWTPLPLPTRPQSVGPQATPQLGTDGPIVWTPTAAPFDPESPFIRLTIQAAQLTQTAQAAATEESRNP